jgi:DNA-directed RNA polymerase alpha subunit
MITIKQYPPDPYWWTIDERGVCVSGFAFKTIERAREWVRKSYPGKQYEEPVVSIDGNIWNTPFEALDCCVRAHHALSYDGRIRTVGELMQASDEELLVIRNLGKKTLREIRESVARFIESHDSAADVVRS